jgi:hypothetical protein
MVLPLRAVGPHSGGPIALHGKWRVARMRQAMFYEPSEGEVAVTDYDCHISQRPHPLTHTLAHTHARTH